MSIHGDVRPEASLELSATKLPEAADRPRASASEKNMPALKAITQKASDIVQGRVATAKSDFAIAKKAFWKDMSRSTLKSTAVAWISLQLAKVGFGHTSDENIAAAIKELGGITGTNTLLKNKLKDLSALRGGEPKAISDITSQFHEARKFVKRLENIATNYIKEAEKAMGITRADINNSKADSDFWGSPLEGVFRRLGNDERTGDGEYVAIETTYTIDEEKINRLASMTGAKEEYLKDLANALSKNIKNYHGGWTDAADVLKLREAIAKAFPGVEIPKPTWDAAALYAKCKPARS